ncbi:MAG: trigger factor [Alphaproteobacteria bacterium]|nr:trigger factor [Alphaproteobacteria bacterium]
MFKKEKIKDLHYSVTGVLTADEIQTAADKILTRHGEKVSIPGFRKGHVPISELRRRYGAAALSEAVDNLMNTDMDKFAKEKKLRLAGAPKAEVAKFEMGQDIEYTLEFDILPELQKINLDSFIVTKKLTEVPESEIEKSLENLRKSRAQAEKQEADCKAQDGDIAVIDFKGFLGTEAFEGGEAKKHHLNLGSGSFIPGFEEKIIGHKAGDKFDIETTFPKEYHSEKLVGKKARFEIEIHEIRRPILPELNDDLAKSVGMENMTALRGHIAKILAEQYEEASKREMRNELLDILAEKIKLDLPENLVSQELEMAKTEAEKHNVKWDEKKEQKDAERRVKLGLILAEWGNQNGVNVTNEDLQKAVWAEASRHPNPQQVFDFYNKNRNAMSLVRGMLFEQKALDAMLNHVRHKEKNVNPEELFKQKN